MLKQPQLLFFNNAVHAHVVGALHAACICVQYIHVPLVQGRFIMFSDDMTPGKTFWRDDVFDIAERPDGPFYHEPGDITLPADGPFYNLPGYLDNFKVRAKALLCKSLTKEVCNSSYKLPFAQSAAAVGALQQVAWCKTPSMSCHSDFLQVHAQHMLWSWSWQHSDFKMPYAVLYNLQCMLYIVTTALHRSING